MDFIKKAGDALNKDKSNNNEQSQNQGGDNQNQNQNQGSDNNNNQQDYLDKGTSCELRDRGVLPARRREQDC